MLGGGGGGSVVLIAENDGKSGPFCPASPISYSLLQSHVSNKINLTRRFCLSLLSNLPCSPENHTLAIN